MQYLITLFYINDIFKYNLFINNFLFKIIPNKTSYYIKYIYENINIKI